MVLAGTWRTSDGGMLLMAESAIEERRVNRLRFPRMLVPFGEDPAERVVNFEATWFCRVRMGPEASLEREGVLEPVIPNRMMTLNFKRLKLYRTPNLDGSLYSKVTLKVFAPFSKVRDYIQSKVWNDLPYFHVDFDGRVLESRAEQFTTTTSGQVYEL